VRFSQLRFTRMYAGDKGFPAHVFPDCPHLRQLMGNTGAVATYNLNTEIKTLKLIRCRWCRSRYHSLWAEDAKVLPELAVAFAMVPRDIPTTGGGAS
jgi:hypothetical protein